MPSPVVGTDDGEGGRAGRFDRRGPRANDAKGPMMQRLSLFPIAVAGALLRMRPTAERPDSDRHR